MLRRLPVIALFLLLAPVLALPTAAQPLAPAAPAMPDRDAEADDDSELSPADRREAYELLLQLGTSKDADELARLEARLIELGEAGADLEQQLQSYVAHGSLESSWRARRILNRLNMEILGDEFWRRRWEREMANPNVPDPAVDPANPVGPDGPVGPLVTPTGEDLTLLELMEAPGNIGIHSEPVVGQSVTWCVGEPDPAIPEDEMLFDVWAVVEVSDSEVWIERHTDVLEPVVMLYRVDRRTGDVLDAFGGREGAAMLHPIHIGGGSEPRLPGSEDFDDEPARMDTPAGELDDVVTMTRTLTVVEFGSVMEITVRDSVSPSVPFNGLVRRVDAEADYTLTVIYAMAEDFERTARAVPVVRVEFDGATYVVPVAEYEAHQGDYDAGMRQPPAGCPVDMRE